MALTTSDAEYERRYAADCRREALVDAMARALCEECYGKGSWSALVQGGATKQEQSWKAQARAALRVVEDWS